jgi:ABC-type transport system involved in multi-copper enzyme maturation permease subunit
MIGELAKFRFSLLSRQKIIWVAFGLSFLISLASYLMATLSFVEPQNVYWDLGLSSLFLLCSFLAVFLGAFLFFEEKKMRTLDWILSMKVSRGQWLVGNFLGISFNLIAIYIVGTLFLFLFAQFFSAEVPTKLILQASVLGLLETCLLLSMALLFGFVVRPLLAVFFVLLLFVFLHSQDSLRLILTDAVSGRFVENRGLSIVLQVSRVFPPLQWFDLRALVGYADALPLLNLGGIALSALLWTLVYLVFGKIYFDRMDL